MKDFLSVLVALFVSVLVSQTAFGDRDYISSNKVYDVNDMGMILLQQISAQTDSELKSRATRPDFQDEIKYILNFKYDSADLSGLDKNLSRYIAARVEAFPKENERMIIGKCLAEIFGLRDSMKTASWVLRNNFYFFQNLIYVLRENPSEDAVSLLITLEGRFKSMSHLALVKRKIFDRAETATSHRPDVEWMALANVARESRLQISKVTYQDKLKLFFTQCTSTLEFMGVWGPF